MFRDIGQWDKLRTLFHPDGRMEASWFQGLFSDFVDASMRMGASDLRTKHVMGTPIISLTNDKAIAETNGFNLLKPRITPYHIVEKAVLCTTAFWPARLPQWVINSGGQPCRPSARVRSPLKPDAISGLRPRANRRGLH
jgi:hypothetical protein